MHKQDMGNNESVVRGITRTASGFMALTFVESKVFKTRVGAEKWLAKRGYNPDGSRKAQA